MTKCFLTSGVFMPRRSNRWNKFSVAVTAAKPRPASSCSVRNRWLSTYPICDSSDLAICVPGVQPLTPVSHDTQELVAWIQVVLHRLPGNIISWLAQYQCITLLASRVQGKVYLLRSFPIPPVISECIAINPLYIESGIGLYSQEFQQIGQGQQAHLYAKVLHLFTNSLRRFRSPQPLLLNWTSAELIPSSHSNLSRSFRDIIHPCDEGLYILLISFLLRHTTLKILPLSWPRWCLYTGVYIKFEQQGEQT